MVYHNKQIVIPKGAKMPKVCKFVTKWVNSQRDFAQQMGLTESSISQMLTGKTKFPIPRFLQTIYYLRPPQEEINKAFNIYLGRLDLPADSLALHLAKELPENTGDETDQILNAVMNSDLDATVKVKIYNILSKRK